MGRPSQYTGESLWPYLPSLIRKAPRFQNAGKSSQATKIESFEATKPPNAKVLSMSTRFTALFDSPFANSDPLCKRKAIQASREAASVILMKAPQGRDHPPEVLNPGQPRTKPSWKTTWLEYRPETQDIRLIMEIEEDVPLTCDGEGTQPKKGSQPGSS